MKGATGTYHKAILFLRQNLDIRKYNLTRLLDAISKPYRNALVQK
jgi:hypothetical protein